MEKPGVPNGAPRMPAPAAEKPARATSAPPPTVIATPSAAPQQAPVPQQTAAPAQPVPAAQVDAGAQRKELQKVRETLALLSARAGSIHSTIQNLQRSQAATGLGMRSDWVQSVTLIDTFLQGSNDALAAGDAASAKDFLEKGERQIERMEKALNK